MVDPRDVGCAAPGNVPGLGNTQERLSKLKATSPQRSIAVTCKSPVGDISAVTLIRTDFFLIVAKRPRRYAQQLEATKAPNSKTERLQPLGWEV